MRERTDSPVHVYQEIDSVDSVEYDVVKSDQGDHLEPAGYFIKRQECLIYPPSSLPI